jgi:hypothetical protein
MKCEIYQRLHSAWKSADQELAHLASQQKKELPRRSDRKARQLANEAIRKRDNASKRMRWHLKGCLDCE